MPQPIRVTRGKLTEHQVREIRARYRRRNGKAGTRNYVAVAPRGFPSGDSEPVARYDWPQTPDPIQEAEHRVFQSIAAAPRK